MTYSFITGIGDDVIALGFFLTILTVLVVFCRSGSSRGVAVENSQLNAARDQLGFQQDAMRVPNDEEDVCPICLDPPAWTCRTNCGHSYCTDCISAYINAAGYAHGLTTSCPCCRQRLTLLVPFFTAQEIANQHERDNHQTLINIFNRRQNSTWIDTIRDAPVLVGYLFSLLTSPNMLGFAFLFRLAIQILALVLYILSPLDIIPEAVFGPLGFLDDILVIFSVIIFWSSLLRRQILRG